MESVEGELRQDPLTGCRRGFDGPLHLHEPRATVGGAEQTGVAGDHRLTLDGQRLCQGERDAVRLRRRLTAQGGDFVAHRDRGQSPDFDFDRRHRGRGRTRLGWLLAGVPAATTTTPARTSDATDRHPFAEDREQRAARGGERARATAHRSNKPRNGHITTSPARSPTLAPNSVVCGAIRRAHTSRQRERPHNAPGGSHRDGLRVGDHEEDEDQQLGRGDDHPPEVEPAHRLERPGGGHAVTGCGQQTQVPPPASPRTSPPSRAAGAGP